jgi:hypothetical protein
MEKSFCNVYNARFSEKLVNITAKHLDIMNIICQNVLRLDLTNTSYEQATKEFLTDSVLKNAGWEKKEGLGIKSLSLLISRAQQKQRQSMSIS